MSPATMRGKVIIMEQLDPNENRFNHNNFNRSIWFMEDLHSLNWIDFCNRYFGMPDYERMYDLIMHYFTTIVLPRRGLRHHDLMTMKRYLYHRVNNTQKRQLYHNVDNTQKRRLYRVCDPVPQIDIKQ